jgi:hypothetical protein
MKIFRTDPTESMQAAQAALIQTEQRIVELQTVRAEKLELAEPDFLSAVSKIDAELAGLRSNVAIYGQRVTAMQVKRHQQMLARLEQEKAAGIADVLARLGKRHAAARKLDAALMQVTQAFAELVKAEEDAFGSTWPASVSSLGRLGHFRIEALEELSSRRMQRPPSAGIVRCVAEHESFQFADAIEARNGQVIEMLEGAPIEQEDAAA